jgi:hypothetical protein
MACDQLPLQNISKKCIVKHRLNYFWFLPLGKERYNHIYIFKEGKMGIRGELFTTQEIVNNRSYFFNVKENRNGDVFLQIVESKLRDGEDDRRAIVVFADDMQKFLSGLDDSLKFIEKDNKERAKIRKEKKAAKEAKAAAEKTDDDGNPVKVIYRRKGESRLVAERRAEREAARQDARAIRAEQEANGIKRSGRVIHVTSKRESEDDGEY